MKVTAMWFGGSSYAVPYPDDVEHFDSLRAAKDAFWSRADFDPYYPCVDKDTTEMWISFGVHESIEYPDRIIKFGPRGGIVVEYA